MSFYQNANSKNDFQKREIYQINIGNLKITQLIWYEQCTDYFQLTQIIFKILKKVEIFICEVFLFLP